MFEDEKHVLLIPVNLALETLRDLKSRFELKRIKKGHYEIISPSPAKLQVWRDIPGSRAQSLEDVTIKELYLVPHKAERLIFVLSLESYFERKRQQMLDELMNQAAERSRFDERYLFSPYMSYGYGDKNNWSPFNIPSSYL